jgi:hypothetical protein
LLCTRKRISRTTPIWNRSTIQKLVRGRQVRGCQSVGRMVGRKRQATEEFIKLYPAVVTEQQWLAAQAAMDARKSGPDTGRNVTEYSNLFGALARCSTCGDRMKIAQIGRTRKFKYLACSASLHRNCEHTKYYRTDRIERDVFALFTGLEWDEQKQHDPSADLAKQLERARNEASKMQSGLLKLVAADADLATIGKASKQHRAKLDHINKLERHLASFQTASPARVNLDVLRPLASRLAAMQGVERIQARGKIAALLPSLLRKLEFRADQIIATIQDGRLLRLGDWRGLVETRGFVITGKINGKRILGGVIPHRHSPVVMEAINKAACRSRKALREFDRRQEARRST